MGVLKSFEKFTGTHLCWSPFFDKVYRNFIKKEAQHKCFPVNFKKILGTYFFIVHLQVTASDNFE